jgi:O-methyltransferase involved in polyketide biosynthesis
MSKMVKIPKSLDLIITRFDRVDNGQVNWYGLDLPEVIGLRKELLEETLRSHFMGCSVLDFSWMDALSGQASK